MTCMVVVNIASVRPAIVQVTIFFGVWWPWLPVPILLVARWPGSRRHVVVLVGGGLLWRRVGECVCVLVVRQPYQSARSPGIVVVGHGVWCGGR